MPDSLGTMRSRRGQRIVAIVALVVIAAGVALVTFRAGDEGEGSATTTTLSPELGAAVLRSDVEIAGVESGDLGGMIEELCASRDGAVLAERVVATGVTDLSEVRALIEGIGRGALAYCPEVPAEAPQLLNEAYDAAVLLLE